MGLQLDMWTDRNTNMSYVAVHITFVAETEKGLNLVDHLLDFHVFPYTSHTADNISRWLVDLLVAHSCPAAQFCGVTPDGASPGLKGLRMVPGLSDLVSVCFQHDMQRAVKYSIGQAGSKVNCPSPDARDLTKINKRVVQFSHQVHEFSAGSRKLQKEADIPQHKWLTTVRSNDTRWGNTYCQLERNNMMRPIIEPFTAAYRREHINDPAILVEDERDELATDDETPEGDFRASAATLSRREIGFETSSWSANLELEAHLLPMYGVKLLMDDFPSMTPSQLLFLMRDLRRAAGSTKALRIKLHPKDIKLESRSRCTAVIQANDLTRMIKVAREEFCTQMTNRFFTKRPSDPRLILLIMSKQGNAKKWMPDEWWQHGVAIYLETLRKVNIKMNLPSTRRSPRKKKSAKRKQGVMFVCAGDSSADEEMPDDSNTDPVIDEKTNWANISEQQVASYRNVQNGLLDEYAFYFAMKPTFPLHFQIFKHYAGDLAVESNAENTFSLSGKLSCDNGKTEPTFLATLTKINSNRAAYKPPVKKVLGAYVSKHGQNAGVESGDEDLGESDVESDDAE